MHVSHFVPEHSAHISGWWGSN
uniref:Uncharacterized protein n=1 Tax=Anguilla anguilla TaxID=7936 RepID=A0A0E9Y1S7_ANGAN